VDGHDGQQLGLRAGLEAVVEGPAELDDLLDHGPVLVDLDRVHAAVLALVPVLLDRSVEGAADELDAGAEDVGEAQQDGQLDAATGELVDELLHVDLAAALATRGDDHVALFADAEVTAAPPRDVVGVEGVGGGPPAQRIVGEENLGAGHFRQLAGTAFRRRVQCQKCPAPLLKSWPRQGFGGSPASGVTGWSQAACRAPPFR
jgi:hypothetical protein